MLTAMEQLLLRPPKQHNHRQNVGASYVMGILKLHLTLYAFLDNPY